MQLYCEYNLDILNNITYFIVGTYFFYYAHELTINNNCLCLNNISTPKENENISQCNISVSKVKSSQF